jgi:response regulator RpfG family c-di-GMP phosphodiesterase
MASINVSDLNQGRFIDQLYEEVSRRNFLLKKNKKANIVPKQTILIIDHEWNILKLLYSVLSKDYNLIIKNSPISAFQWIANEKRPSLIICEYKFPHFTGGEFVQQLRNSGFHGSIPIIILSDAEDLEHKISLLPCDIHGTVSKPFNPVLLTSTIQKVLHEYTT